MSLTIKPTKPQTRPRSLSLEEVATIIEETVIETEKDLKKFSNVFQRIAKISLFVAENLREKDIAIDMPKNTRSLQSYGIITQAVQTALEQATDRTLKKSKV